MNSIDNLVMKQEINDAIRQVLKIENRVDRPKTLSKGQTRRPYLRYMTVIYYRFHQNMTLADVGKIMGLTNERIRQMEGKGLRLISNQLKKKNLVSISDFNNTYCNTSNILI